MKTIIRLQLNMAVSANAFCQAHPDPSTGGQAMAGQLDQLVTHAEDLVQQQRAGQATSAAATARKAELRQSLQAHFTSLVGIGRTAARTEPGVTFHFRLPKGRTSDAAFVALSRVAVAEARANQARFIELGMPADLLDTLASELDEFEREAVRQRQSIAAHVGAGAELGAVMKELLAHLKHIDALQRLRFRDQPELAASWKSARNVAYPIPTKGAAAGQSDKGQAA